MQYNSLLHTTCCYDLSVPNVFKKTELCFIAYFSILVEL